MKYSQRQLYIQGIGEIKANYHRNLSGTPKAITIKREGKKWWLSVRCAGVAATPLPLTGKDVGIDLGVVNLVTTSSGDILEGPRFGSRSAEQLAIAQQKLSRMQLGSKRRTRQVGAVAHLHRKIKNQRLNAAHQISRQLVDNYDLIAVEDLKIKNMVKSPKPTPDLDTPGEYLPNGAAAKAGLNKAIHDGGHTEAGNRRTQAKFACLRCGHRDHADVNAAKNVLRAGRALQVNACAAQR